MVRLLIPVNIIDDLREANKTGMGLVSLVPNLKKGELLLTQAEAPESTRTVSDKFAVASMAQMRTLAGLAFCELGCPTRNFPELISRTRV
jgi:hypothetical protein